MIRVVVAVVLALGGSAPAASAEDLRQHVEDDRIRLYAVEYARSDGVPVARLVRGARGRVDMSWYFFVAVGHGRVVLIDCGTDALARPGRAALRERWSIARAVTVVEALSRLGLSPGDVTDVVLTHFHWDHTGALGRFPSARVHVHRGEWSRLPRHLRGPVERDDRLNALDGSRAELAPGVAAHEAGHHTAHQLLVSVTCHDREVIVAGDASYLYANVEQRRPVTVTTDSEANVAATARAATEVGASNVLPGHDPAVFERHPSATEGVAAICP